MPGKVGVKIKAGRNLPVMDRGSDTTDAYVEIKLGNVTHKTDVCRKTLNPQWNTDWYRFEVDDAELQDEPLQIRLMDHDTYSANDAIGKVNISLNPLCLENVVQSNQGKGAVMSGWIPVFDTMHGIRGEVNIIVKVDLFSDANKFRQSSCGVQFFHSPCIPHGYRAQVIHGFVEELVVNDDPEYQWIDKIRTPRASNEARQVVFLTLSGQVQRKIGLKAINLGANAVIGYAQCFDLEGDVGVVVRGIGTAVTLVKIQETINQPAIDNALIEERRLNYLKFLSGAGGNNSNDMDDLIKSKFETDYIDLDPNNVVYKILGIEPIDKCSARSPNIIVKHKWKPNIKDNIIYEESFNENDGMRQLLEQEDGRGEKLNRKFHHHVKRITNTSKTLLNEKFNAFKARLNDEKSSENDSKSLNSSWSDISLTETARSSLTDLRNLMRFKKAKKYNRSISDGSAMTTLLVSSVMYGRDTSLESISEAYDSARNSPTRIRTNSKSESMSNLLSSSCEDKAPVTKLGKDIKSESLKNLVLKSKLKKENKFPRTKLPPLQNVTESNNSISTISGSSSSSSSDEDEECSDDDEEECSEITANEVVVVDPDTVSMVVKSVLAKCLQQEDSDNWIQPGSTIGNDDDDSGEKGPTEISLMPKKISFIKQVSTDSEGRNDEVEEIAFTASNNPRIIQTGATRILETDKDARITVSKIIETDATAKKLETMLKQPSVDEDADNWIEPGSTTDEPETIDRGRRQSLLHDLKENISGKFHHLQEQMHLPHFTDHSKILHKHGLLDTAMETMLMEKANIFGAETALQTQTLPSSDNNQNSEIINEKLSENFPLLEEHNNEERKHDKTHHVNFDLIAKKLHLPFGHHKVNNTETTHKSEIKDESGLLGNAMRTMLMEPFNFAEEICHEGGVISPLRTAPLDSPISEIPFQFKNDQIIIDKVDKEKSMCDIGCKKKDFKELNLPINSKTCNLQQQQQNIKVDQELGKFYSSEPELNQTNDIMLLPLNYGSQPAPFLSLTNLNVMIIKKSNENNCENDYNSNNNNCSSLISNNSQLTQYSNTNNNSYVLPKAIIIHPSTPLTSPETPSKLFSFDDINPNQINTNTTVTNKSNVFGNLSSNESNNIEKVNVIIKKTIYLVDNNNINNNDNAKNNLNNNNNINYINNKKSSSYTNLSCTNKAPLLAPSPYYLKRQLRSSTELVASGSTSPAIQAGTLGQQQIKQTTTAVASTQATMSAITLTMSNAMNDQQHLTPIQQQGHNRAESVGGGGSGVNKTLSPAKVSGNIGSGTTTSGGNNSLPSNNKNQEIYRRSSDSDLSVTPKGNSICVASDRLVAATTMMRLSAPTSLKNTNPENLDMLEYPFLTMCKYPTGFILHLGATVAARSVKLLERVPNPDEPETRDSWWTELRMEIRSHARALGCNVILGYSEVTTISDDVCVLSATGTAAVINMSYSGEASQYDCATASGPAAAAAAATTTISSSKKDLMVSSLDERECLRDGVRNNPLSKDNYSDLNYVTKEFSSSFGGTTKTFPNNFLQNKGCAMCHIPYSTAAVPFNIRMKKCAVCKRGKVPDVLLATIEIPECLQITGRGCFMQAQVVRAKKDLRSESNAKEISDGLPFLEYELHRLLINKLKAKGMNAIFGLKAHVAIGEKMMALIATGTAVFLTALPPPSVPKIVAGNSWHDTARLNDLQKSLQETVERNREIYQLKNMDPDYQNGSKQSDTDDSDEELLEMDLNAGNKDTCVLEVDDIEDLEIISLLMEPCPPEGFHVVNTQSVPGLHDMEVVKNLQMFTQIWRAKLTVGSNNERFPKHFQRLLQTIYFKLRTMIPCAICDLKFRLDLPESDEIQLLVTGMALGLGEPSKLSKIRRKTIGNNHHSNETSLNSTIITNGGSTNKKSQDEELIFSLDEDQNSESPIQFIQTATGLTNLNYGTHSLKLKKNSPSRNKFTSSIKYSRHLPLHDRYGVDITPLSYVPGGKIEKYLGNLNFFFIRESTSIRENGGISGFVHSFITEILAVVRAHISALGGNAMVSFYMTELLLVDNQHKNQGQCLVNIGGDVVFVSYFADD